jgi:uroporphyrinogen-III synthase
MARQSVPVLVTRPATEGAAFAEALELRFGLRVRPLVAPLMAPRFLSPTIPDRDYAAVVFTSAQAVAASRNLRLPALAWCVGHKTAAVATAAGFTARSADGDAQTLTNAILANPPNGRILYLRGVDTRGNLLEKLTSAGLGVDVAVVYEQEPQPFGPEALALLTAPGDLIVPLFSPRTATLFRQSVPLGTPSRLHIAALSRAVADPLDGLPRAALAIAPQPDTPGMLDAVESLLANRPVP